VGGESGEGVLMTGGVWGGEDVDGPSGGGERVRDKAETEREKDTHISADVHRNTHTHTHTHTKSHNAGFSTWWGEWLVR